MGNDPQPGNPYILLCLISVIHLITFELAKVLSQFSAVFIHFAIQFNLFIYVFIIMLKCGALAIPIDDVPNNSSYQKDINRMKISCNDLIEYIYQQISIG